MPEDACQCQSACQCAQGANGACQCSNKQAAAKCACPGANHLAGKTCQCSETKDGKCQCHPAKAEDAPKPKAGHPASCKCGDACGCEAGACAC